MKREIHEVHIGEARSRVLESVTSRCNKHTYLLATAKVNLKEITERLPDIVNGIKVPFVPEDLILEICNDIQLQRDVDEEDLAFCLETCEKIIKSSYETIYAIYKYRLPEQTKLEYIHLVNELSKPYVSHSIVNVIEHVQQLCDNAVVLVEKIVSMYTTLYADMLEGLNNDDWLDNPSRYVSEFVEPLDMLNMYVNILAHVAIVFDADACNPVEVFRHNLLGIWFCVHSVVSDINTLDPEDRYVVYIPKPYYDPNVPLYKQIDEYTK